MGNRERPLPFLAQTASLPSWNTLFVLEIWEKQDHKVLSPKKSLYKVLQFGAVAAVVHQIFADCLDRGLYVPFPYLKGRRSRPFII